MRHGINKVILLGRVGLAPEVKVFEDGGKRVRISLATSDGGYTTRDGKEVPESTEWHNCVFNGGQASAVESVEKGEVLYIEGKKKTRKYTKDDIEREAVEIIVTMFEFAGSKKEAKPQEYESEGITPEKMRDVYKKMAERTTAQDDEEEMPF